VVKKVNEIIRSFESIQREKGEVRPQVVNDAKERLKQVSELSPIFSIATIAEKSSARLRSQPMNTPAKLRGER
jgi:hypothetical protein